MILTIFSETESADEMCISICFMVTGLELWMIIVLRRSSYCRS
jgi:hypothetical protein